MTREADEPPTPRAADAKAPFRLAAVSGPVPVEGRAAAPPPVRLRREFKGLTVADLQREDVVRRLPGQVSSALELIEMGDFAAAERALPGHLSAVLPGPGNRRWRRRRVLLLTAAIAVLALAIAAASAVWSSA